MPPIGTLVGADIGPLYWRGHKVHVIGVKRARGRG